MVDKSNEAHNELIQQQEYLDVDCARLRAERVPVAHVVSELAAEINSLQRTWIERLADRGIILEFNPSSNLRVSASSRVQDIPFVAVLNALRDRILATINTDNPGVFSTRIENEYAIALQALEACGIDRAGRIAIADRLRDVGMRFVYWPARATHTEELA
jgi:hypothetical protein